MKKLLIKIGLMIITVTILTCLTELLGQGVIIGVLSYLILNELGVI